MKKMFIFCMLLWTISNLSFGQKLNPVVQLTREDYLVKSQKQKRIALAIGIPGAVLACVGTVLFMSEFSDGLSVGTDYNANVSNTGELLAYIGGGLILVAIPFEIASRTNKKKAMTITVKNQRTPCFNQYHMGSNFNPSLNLAINF